MSTAPRRSRLQDVIWRAPLVPAAIAFTAGIVLDRQLSIPLPLSLAAVCALLFAWGAASFSVLKPVAVTFLAPALLFTGWPGPDAWPILCASGLIHTVYMIALVHAYTHGDLSVVYPVARGAAPLLVAIAAPLFLRERLSYLGMAGIGLVGGGITWLGFSARHSRTT